MVHFDTRPDEDKKVSGTDPAEELTGKLGNGDQLMKSVLESDKETIEKGKLIESALNNGLSAFTPDILFDKMVNNYRLAESIYGERMFRLLSGYSSEYIERNIKIPEFQRELKQRIDERMKELSKDKVIDNKLNITERGISLASLVMLTEELDNIMPKGMFGERAHKKRSHYGSRDEVRDFTGGDRYRDIALRKSVKTAARRKHKRIDNNDLKVFERESRGKCYIIYALDASGSMRGEKLGSCKKAGVALAYKATMNRDKVGLIVFGDEIRAQVEPTHDFPRLLREMTTIRASKQTDIVKTIKRAITMFPRTEATKHLILLSDALPTAGDDPERKTLEAVSMAGNRGITISVAGINLDRKGEALAKRIAEIGKGRLYRIKDLKDMDRIILEDYHSVV
ncbi:MAG: VWA domain-containing protein [Candidatus Woesearchaeota archaeon]